MNTVETIFTSSRIVSMILVPVLRELRGLICDSYFKGLRGKEEREQNTMGTFHPHCARIIGNPIFCLQPHRSKRKARQHGRQAQNQIRQKTHRVGNNHLHNLADYRRNFYSYNNSNWCGNSDK